MVAFPDCAASTTDDGNSSTTPLGIAGVFTGTGRYVEGFSTIVVTAFADQGSAVGGFSVQFSMDGTNWDLPTNHTLFASVPLSLTLPVIAQYFRVVFTNGGVAQGAFRLQTLLRMPGDPVVLPSVAGVFRGRLFVVVPITGTAQLIGENLRRRTLILESGSAFSGNLGIAESQAKVLASQSITISAGKGGFLYRLFLNTTSEMWGRNFSGLNTHIVGVAEIEEP